MALPEAAPYLLTPIDNSSPRIHWPTFLFFPEPETSDMSTAVDTLRRGLSGLLQGIPLFSGTIKPTGQRGRLCVAAPWNDVDDVFQVKNLSHEEGGLEYQSLKSKRFPMEDLGDLLALIPLAQVMKSERPVVLVQLNIIKGGMIMVLGVHHSFTDGNGVFAITEVWAAYCKGEDGSQLVTKEMLDRERLMRGWEKASLADTPEFCVMPPKRQAPSNGVLSSINAVVAKWLTGPSYKLATRIRRWIVGTETADGPSAQDALKTQPATFFFSKSKLAELKSLASSKENGEDHDKWISTNDALCALIGCCILSAGENQIRARSDRTCSIGMVVGGRRSLDPPLPAGYLGNVYTFAGVIVPSQSMQSTPAMVSEIAHGLRDQIKQRDERYLRKVIAALSSVEDISRVQPTPPRASEDVMAFSSWANQKFHDIDWGEAVGTQVESVRARSQPGLCIILPEMSAPRFAADACGLEAAMNLTKREMERLKQNELFIRFAEWRCN